jgi:1-acyl-sn-glycerol-3-phosphate acyltransferase
MLIKASGVQLEIIGEHNIKDNKNYIFAPNHSSFMDFPVLFVAINKYLVFVAKKELKKIPIFKSILNVSGFIFVDRDNTSDAIDSLNELKSDIKNTPRSVVVFPEGTRSSSNQLQSFKKGAAVLSIKTGLPIIPVYIMGSFDWWDTKNFRKNSNKIVVNFGKPIITENKQYEDRENITNSIKKEIIKLQNNEI